MPHLSWRGCNEGQATGLDKNFFARSSIIPRAGEGVKVRNMGDRHQELNNQTVPRSCRSIWCDGNVTVRKPYGRHDLASKQADRSGVVATGGKATRPAWYNNGKPKESPALERRATVWYGALGATRHACVISMVPHLDTNDKQEGISWRMATAQ